MNKKLMLIIGIAILLWVLVTFLIPEVSKYQCYDPMEIVTCECFGFEVDSGGHAPADCNGIKKCYGIVYNCIAKEDFIK